MRARAHASPDDIDITSIWVALKKSAARILAASALAGALSFAVLSLMAPRYMSEARLTIEAKGSSDPFKDPRRQGGDSEAINVRMDREAINTHVQALQSSDLAANIATELKLATRKEFNAALGSPDTFSALLRVVGIGAPKAGESEQDRVLASYFKQLEVYSPKESRSIIVRFSSMDREFAATVANQIAETYRGSLATELVVESEGVEKALEPKIAKLKVELASAEAEAERFRGEANIFKGGQQSTGLNEQQLGELTAELSKVKAARSEAEARAKSARDMMKLGSADALPDVQKSPLIQNLVQQRVRLERQVSEVSASLLPGHPRMQQLNADLTGLKRQLNAEVAKVVDSLDKEAKVTALREDSITKSLNETKSRVVTTGPDEVKLRSFEANAKAKRSELESLQAKYEAARARADDSKAVPVEARIDSKARPSGVAYFPKKGPLALLASMAIGLFGIALTITRSLLTGARRGAPIEAPSLVRPPVAASQRAEPVFSPGAALVVPEPPPAPGTAQADDRFMVLTDMASVAGHVEARAPDGGGCRTLVVGESAAIDCGAEAIGLVKELASRGHAVLLIDWNPDGSGLAQKLGLMRTPGATEVLQGSAKFEDVIQQLRDTNVHFIASGAALPYGSEGPSADQLNLVLDALDEAYMHIVVTGPYDAARALFEVIEGRFDAGVTVADPKSRAPVIQSPPGTFMGYEVADIELIRFERKEGAVSAQRILRATGQLREERRPA